MQRLPIAVAVAVLAMAILSMAGCGRVPTKGEDSIYAVAEAGDTGTLRAMLRKNFDVNAPDESGMTLLHHAAVGNQPSVIEMLLNEYPAKVDATDSEGRTALDIANEMGNEDAAAALESER
jgi:ankyrin repeat protein